MSNEEEMLKGMQMALKGTRMMLKSATIDDKLKGELGPEGVKRWERFNKRYMELHEQGEYDKCEKLKAAFINGEQI